MSDMICSRTGSECERASDCELVTEHARGSIVSVKHALGSGDAVSIGNELVREISHQAQHRARINLYPARQALDIVVCPSEAFDSETGRRIGVNDTAAFLNELVDQAVQRTTVHIRNQEARFSQY